MIRWWICMKKCVRSKWVSQAAAARRDWLPDHSPSWRCAAVDKCAGLPVPFSFIHFSYLGGLLVHLVLVGPNIGCHPIVGVMFLTTFLCSYFSQVLLVSLVYTHSVFARYLTDNTFLLPVFWGLLHLHFWGSFWTYRPSSLPLVANPFEPLTESWYVRDEQELGGSWLVREEWDGVGRPLRYPSTTASGYPLSLNTCLRCLISWHLVLPSHTFLVLCFGHRMMSLLTLAKWLE